MSIDYYFADCCPLTRSIVDDLGDPNIGTRSIMPPKPSLSSRLVRKLRKDKGTKDPEKSKRKNDGDLVAPGAAASSIIPSTSSENIVETSITAGDIFQSPQTSQSVEPQSHEQVTLPIPQSASFAQPLTTFIPAATGPTTSTNPIPTELWDLAYDSLKTDESTLVKAYEKVLSHELYVTDSSSIPSKSQENAIEQTNRAIRRSQMSDLVQAGLRKTERLAKAKEGVGNVIQVVLSANEIISSAVQSVPQAAAAWSGVCLALQILLNPTQTTKANREGIVYILSRMHWYWELSSLLLKENLVDGDPSKGLRYELKQRIVDLYKTLLSYEMKSVCSYYQNQTIVILRDIIKLDDWNGNLSTVRDAENALRQDSHQYNTEQIKSSLEQLVDIAKTKEITLLQDIHNALQDQSAKKAEREDNRCLQDLRVTDPRDDMKRIEATKGGLLKDSYAWILSHPDFIDWKEGDETRLLWIKGEPGKGKTMLLIGVVRELEESTHDSTLLSYFFCQGTDSRLNNATAVLRGLIYQLLDQQPSLISHVREQYDKAGRQLFKDVNAFVALSRIFTRLLHDPCLTRIYLVVDALDECESELSQLLSIITQNASTSSSRVKWLLSSRYRREIEEQLRINANRVNLSLELNAESVSAAVDAYIASQVSELAQTKKYDHKLQKHVEDQLHQKANGTFLWVALVCKELRGVEGWDVPELLQEIPSDLTQLYGRMIEQTRKLKKRSVTFCTEVLSISTLAYRPLHLLELAALADLPKEFSCDLPKLTKIIELCGSFLTIREDTVYFIHQSAKDYLNEDPTIFPPGQRTVVHCRIMSRSLQNMSDTLRRDIYNLEHPGISIDQVQSLDPDPLARIRYACGYWIYHLCEVKRPFRDELDLSDNGRIDKFLKTHFLHWLETLSLTRNLSSGVVMIRKLENFLAQNLNHVTDFLSIVRDAVRFILYNRYIIESSPLQVYASALVFSPTMSRMRTLFQDERPRWIITGPLVDENWSLCLQTLEGHTDCVTSVAFSHDGRRLASGSYDMMVRIWDAETGVPQQTLEGHTDWVRSVTFSHDGRRLASGSDDRTVRIWDAETGVPQQTLEIGIVCRVPEFSSDDFHLITELGCIDLSQSFLLPKWSGYCLNADRSWITCNGKKVLWLPPEYRPYTSIFKDQTVAIGIASGVLLIRFDSNIPPTFK